MLKGERLMEFPRRNFVDRPIEKLDMPFAAVATALHTGATPVIAGSNHCNRRHPPHI